MDWYKNYKYKGLTMIGITTLVTILLSKNNFINNFIFENRNIPFIGSIVAGILYASTSTVALGAFILSDLAKKLPAIEIALLAGIGTTIADFMIFRFFKDDLISELTPLYNKLGGRRLTKLAKHKSIQWLMPIIGAIIIASPFPDEIGIGLMGLSHIKNYQFVLLCLVLDISGVFLLVSAFSLVK
jgi:hypothetical protein